MLPRICVKCGDSYQIDADEIADGSYSPLCTECLRRNCEKLGTPEYQPTEERVIGELN